MPKLIGIGWLGAASQMGEIQPQKLFLLYLILPFISSCKPLHTTYGLTDLHECGSNDAVCWEFLFYLRKLQKDPEATDTARENKSNKLELSVQI